MRIGLGDLAKDKITGFEGIVTARTEWLNRCVRLQLQPRALHEGRVLASEVFDEEQLELVSAGAIVIEKELPTGGDRPDTAMRRNGIA